MPNPVQTTCAPSSTSPCRVFISYSRNDSWLAEEFFEHLELAFRNSDSPYGPNQIFFDKRDIQAGDLWEQEILPALDSAEVVILLVSVHTFKYRYCWNHEVPRAVKAGKRIIPVLLSACTWEKMPMGEGGRALDPVAAVPVLDWKGERRLVPVTQGISTRQERDERWTECVRAIQAALRESVRPESSPPPAVLAASAPKSRKLPPALPILCDQAPARAQLRQSIRRECMQKALFVLIQGGEEDQPLDFWRRVTDYELQRIDPDLPVRIATAHRSHDLTRVPPRSGLSTFLGRLGSRFRTTGGMDADAARLHDQVLRDLWSSLSQHVDPTAQERVPTASQAAELPSDRRLKILLDQLDRTQPVLCLLSSMSPGEALDAIGALAQAVARLEDTTPVHRLAFGFIWRGQEDLAAEFSRVVHDVPRPACHSVALPRLEAFGQLEVQDWLRTHELSGSLDESKFLKHAFPDPAGEIRFRHLFDSYEAFAHP